MPFIMKLYSLAHEPNTLYPNKFLKSFDPDGNNGRGEYVTARDLSEAQLFITAKDAINLWQTVSKLRPYRPDGEPNKPLTAFNVEIFEI